MKPQNMPTLLAAAAMAAAITSSPSIAGETAPSVEAPSNPGDWCEWLQNKPGTLYKNKENSWIQEFQLMGRFHYQAAYVDGEDVNGNDFNESYDDYRRARLGATGKFLEYFGFFYQVNLVADDRYKGGDLDWDYQDIDEAYLTFDLGKALGDNPFDKLVLSYGRHKYLIGQEVPVSSTKIITIERSGIANKVYESARPTGLKIDAELGDWSYSAALFSSTRDGAENEEFNGWQDSVMYSAHVGYKVNDELRLGADFVYNDADATTEDSILSYRWVTALGGEYSSGPWGIMADLIYGDNGGNQMHASATQRGGFWGVVVRPHYWIVGEKLQAVVQYQYAAAEEAEGIRIHSRYGRADGITNINSGRGDSHHQFYAGLNYYLCGHNAKIMGGIEYQTMDTPTGDFNTLTYEIAFRTFF